MTQPWKFLADNWRILLPVFLGMAAIYLLLPRARRYPPLWGSLLGGLALVLSALLLLNRTALSVETVLFYAFSGLAILSGVMMIAHSNPVYAALSFALVVLSTCGLFLLQAAPFLMAATIIIYAGAIIVTFLFVIMLAQQEGPSDADQRSREPFFAALTGFLLLGALLWVLNRSYDTSKYGDIRDFVERTGQASEASDVERIRSLFNRDRDFLRNVEKSLNTSPENKESKAKAELVDELREVSDGIPWNDIINDVIKLDAAYPKLLKDQFKSLHAKATRYLEYLESAVTPGVLTSNNPFLSNLSGARPNPDEVPRDETGRPRLPAKNVAAVGRALYTDYLLPVQLAAALLLVATIGAIAIAGRRTEGLR